MYFFLLFLTKKTTVYSSDFFSTKLERGVNMNKEKIICPFTNIECNFYRKRPYTEDIGEKQIMNWCFLCILGQIFQILKIIKIEMPKDR